MNDIQIAYTLILALLAVFAWKRQRYALLWLVGNLVVTLFVCLLMDLGTIDRDDTTKFFLVIDLASGVGLALRPGIPTLIAFGYAITVPLYFANLVFGVEIDATFAIIYRIAFAQLGVLCLGLGMGGNSGGGRRRRFTVRLSMVEARRNAPAHQVVVCKDDAG